MKLLATVCLLLILPSSLSSQYAYLRVQHPQQFYSYTGTIEEARLEVTPKGIYTQNDLYLTFSARGVSFSPNDSVEVQLDFELPKECVVNDLWLWIDDTTISKGYILDKWTASSIYENIVRRRRDPALLTKEFYATTGWDYYKLRVYPMLGSGTRKVKISYLVPAQWTRTQVSAHLPAHIFRVSWNKLSEVELLYKRTLGWGTPRVVESSSLLFSTAIDSALGDVYRCVIPSSNFSSYGQTLTLGAGSPMKNGVYLTQFREGDDGIYHLAVIPAEVLDVTVSKKVVFLFDYDSLKTSWQKQDMLYYVRSHLETHYTAADSFNLIFTQAEIYTVGQTWYSGSLQGIASAFQSAGPSPIMNKSNLVELIKKGIEFIKANGGSGTLCIVGSSDKFGDYQVANPAINELQGLLTPSIQISVVDFLNRNYNYYYFGGYYYGNDYFYENLTKLTKGYWTSARSSTPSNMFSGFARFIAGTIGAFDLYTRLEQGVCYARFTSMAQSMQAIYTEEPVLQIGKTKGSGSFSLDLVGIHNGEIYENHLVIPENEIAVVDTFLSKAWTGKYIGSLDNEHYLSNTVTSQIVEASLNDRVLSRFTAFLALEPNDSSLIVIQNPGPGGGGGPTAVEQQTEVATEEPIVQAYPNPFNAQTTIRLRLPKGITSEQVSLSIYNLLGQLVRTLSADRLNDSQTRTVVWNGRNDDGVPVTSGMYFFVLTTPKGKHTLKLIILK